MKHFNNLFIYFFSVEDYNGWDLKNNSYYNLITLMPRLCSSWLTSVSVFSSTKFNFDIMLCISFNQHLPFIFIFFSYTQKGSGFSMQDKSAYGGALFDFLGVLTLNVKHFTANDEL